jgi:hypothetical protein
MVRACSALSLRSSRAASRIRSARVANGTLRHSTNAACARVMIRSSSAGDVALKVWSTSPVAGLTD